MKSLFFLILIIFILGVPTSFVFAYGDCSEYGSMAYYEAGYCKCMSGYIFSDNGILGKTCVSKTTYCYDKYGYNATYDILADSCKCRSGYIMSKNILGNATCISADGECKDEYGVMARYDSLTDKCKCSYGYVFGTDSIGRTQCISEDDWCHDKYGYNSRYNSLSDKCECRSGYELSLKTGGGLECESCYSKYGLHASFNSLTDKCECDKDYTLNDNNQCVKKQNNVYFLLEALDVDNNKAVIKSDYDYREYLVDYGVGCLSIENYINRKFIVNLGTDFDLDTWDKIILQDNDQVCDITYKETTFGISDLCDNGYILKNNRCEKKVAPQPTIQYVQPKINTQQVQQQNIPSKNEVVEKNEVKENPKIEKNEQIQNNDKDDSKDIVVDQESLKSYPDKQEEKKKEPLISWNKIFSPVRNLWNWIFKR